MKVRLPAYALLLSAALAHAAVATAAQDTARIQKAVQAENAQNAADSVNAKASAQTAADTAAAKDSAKIAADTAPAKDSAKIAADTAPAIEDSLVLDFEKALKAVIESNTDVQEAKYEWLSYSEMAKGYYGEFEPHLIGRVNKERADKPGALFTETKDEYKIGIQGKLPTGTEYNVGFNQATYTHSDYTSELYFGGELRQHLLKDGLLYFTPTNNIRQARLQREIAYQKYRYALNEILEKFHDSYWNYYYAQQTLMFATESARVAKQITEDASKRLQLGMLSSLDYQKTIAEYSDRESARLAALDQLRGARLTLLLMLSVSDIVRDPRPIAIRPESEVDTTNVADSLIAPDSVCSMHPAYLQQKAELDLREEELHKHKTSFLPTVDLIGSYGIRTRDKDARKAVREFKHPEDRQTVLAGGIEIDVPLFANVHERHQISAEKANVRAARTRLALIQNRLYEEYRILQNRAREIREQWKYSRTAVTYHETELQEEFKKMELGKSNYHQIFEMEEDLRAAQQRHLENMRDLRVIDVRLSRAKGKLLLQNGLENWKQGALILREELLHE
ncbi:MAG: TolC family protein [Fibrobacter sp.]|uniref:TolC family protein n=1 Tax=Fibrobacter sp. TaxID=35828 RepID=UPI0025BE89B6|nr:TolC family protein [Fibrobacter sp.]MBR4784831.1 TolC family protein [Fibrobacter sp.]